MKLLKTLTAAFLLCTITFSGCKNKSPKELIVSKWKVTAVSDDQVDPGSKMPEAEKKELIEKTLMEFTADGKCMITSREGTENGSYTLSEDGKTLSMKQDGTDRSDKVDVNELSENKLVLTDLKSKMKLTLAKK